MSHASQARARARAQARRVVVLSGGVGGAKLALGMARVVPPSDLIVIVNTADDFRRFGLAVSPDVDTVLYTLAGLANPATGWGLAGDTGHVMDAVRALDAAEAWFFLGDRDLATHLVRTARLASGASLTEVTRALAERLGVATRVLPMSNDPVASRIHTAAGELEFQDWFVRRKGTPPALAVHHEGIERAAPTPEVLDALGAAEVVVLAPSNPYLSLGPILALPGVPRAIRAPHAPVVAVSPLIDGRAVKGPTAELMARLAGGASNRALAQLYSGLVDGLVIDRVDAGDVEGVRAAGMRVCLTDTLMQGDDDRVRLARATLDFADEMARDAGRRADG